MGNYKKSNPLTENDRERYTRQLRLPEVGEDGQARLKDSSVLVVGAGGLGSAALLYLAAAGVGHIGIADPDRVALSNLHRQVIHCVSTLGELKVESARRRLLENNPSTILDLFPAGMKEENADSMVAPYDVVVDATDNLETRRLINQVCVRYGKPMVFGSAMQFEGQLGVFDAHRGPCYRCAFPKIPPPGTIPTPAEAGVIGPLPGVIGTLQALETLKILLGAGTPLYDRLLLFDGLQGRFEEIHIHRNPQCQECGSL